MSSINDFVLAVAVGDLLAATIIAMALGRPLLSAAITAGAGLLLLLMHFGGVM